MASYRFCRTDDWSLLAAAHEACVRPHAPGLPALDVAALKRAARELDLWASSCMVALEGGEPVAVLLATKRDDAALVWRMGLRPGHERRGHGRHLLDSLRAKQAILGPPKLLAEVPSELAAARAFFKAVGFREECELTDFVLTDLPDAAASLLVVPASHADLVTAGVLGRAPVVPWERAPRSLAARGHQLHGWAVAAGEQLAAWLLVEATAGADAEDRIAAIGVAEPAQAPIWLPALLAEAGRSPARALRLPGAHPEEIAFDVLQRLGFVADRRAVRFAADPQPA